MKQFVYLIQQFLGELPRMVLHSGCARILTILQFEFGRFFYSLKKSDLHDMKIREKIIFWFLNEFLFE